MNLAKKSTVIVVDIAGETGRYNTEDMAKMENGKINFVIRENQYDGYTLFAWLKKEKYQKICCFPSFKNAEKIADLIDSVAYYGTDIMLTTDARGTIIAKTGIKI